MQLHRVGQEVKYFSRTGHDHGDKSDYGVLDEMVHRQLKCQRVILDGELIAWNKTRCAPLAEVCTASALEGGCLESHFVQRHVADCSCMALKMIYSRGIPDSNSSRSGP